MHLTIIIQTVFDGYLLLISLQGCLLKVSRSFNVLDLSDNSVGVVDLRDFVNYSEDSPVPQSHHTQD